MNGGHLIIYALMLLATWGVYRFEVWRRRAEDSED